MEKPSVRAFMTTPQMIRVPERGNTDVSSTAWKELSRSPRFWSLVERRIVSVEQLPAGCVRLCGGCYVGRSSVSDEVVLELHEKVPGSLASLLRFASGADFRVEHIPGPSSDLGSLIALLVAHFVEAVRQYAARGRQFRYEQEPMKGSLVGGRLDVTRTIGLWARGLRHLAAFEKNVVSFDLPINRTVLAALREVERIGRLISLPRDVVARVRAMAMLFDDCRNAEVLFGTRAEAARRADALASAASDKVTADMLALAAILLSHESFEHDSTHVGTAPRSWFLNLETLFERAVRETMKAAFGSEGTVSSGRAAPLPIFPPRSDLFSANPDLVLRRHGVSRAFVGDVKYKQWGGVPSASDVYQLLVHAAAFESKIAFLVFPFDGFDARVLGNAVTGACVKLYGLDVRELDIHIGRLLGDLGIVPEIHMGTTAGVGAA
jgi:5-methylcytosine-specific restriction endonuclease McrBC regulatory subunit McrC